MTQACDSMRSKSALTSGPPGRGHWTGACYGVSVLKRGGVSHRSRARTTWLAVLFDKTRRGALRKHGRDAECQSSKLEWRTGKPFYICPRPVRSGLFLCVLEG